jgi:hypothetical protein
VFNRIHVGDWVAVLLASIERPNGSAVYNVSDDEPAPADEVVISPRHCLVSNHRLWSSLKTPSYHLLHGIFMQNANVCAMTGSKRSWVSASAT